MAAKASPLRIGLQRCRWCVFSLECRPLPMTIPFGEPEPSDALLNKSVASTRLRIWLTERLRHLAGAQRIQDARALRREFSLE